MGVLDRVLGPENDIRRNVTKRTLCPARRHCIRAGLRGLSIPQHLHSIPPTSG